MLGARVRLNSTYLAIANVFQYLLTFVSGVLIARVLGADSLGVFGLASAIGQIAGRIADCGMQAILTRSISRSEPSAMSRLTNALAFRLWTGIASVAAVELFACAVGYEIQLHVALLLYTSSLVVAGLRDVAGCVYVGRESMARPAAAAALFRLVSFVLTSAFLFLGLGVNWTILALLLGQVFAAGYLARGSENRIVRLPVVFHWREIHAVLQESYPLAIASIFGMINLRIDTAILSLHVTRSAVGVYSAAFSIIIGLALFPNSFLTALYPALARGFHTDRPQALRLFVRSQLLSGTAGLLVALGLGLTSHFVMRIVYGKEFTQAGSVLTVLGWAVPCMYLSYANAIFFNAADRQRLNLWTSVLSGTTNTVANLILIPKHGIYGAAWATFISESIFLVVTSILVAALFVEYRSGDVKPDQPVRRDAGEQ